MFQLQILAADDYWYSIGSFRIFDDCFNMLLECVVCYNFPLDLFRIRYLDLVFYVKQF